MMIFKYHKKVNLFIAFITLIGVFTIFLPWMEYPKIEMVLKGSDGDGWVISFLFLMMLLGTLYMWFSKIEKHGRKINIMIFFFSILILALSVSKILTFNAEVNANLSTDALVNYASAGANLKSGLYVISGLSFVLGVLSILGLLFTKVRNLVILAVIFALIGLTYFFVNQSQKARNRISEREKIANMERDFQSMSQALIYKTPEIFVNYVHPIIYQSIGGKAKMASIIKELYNNINITGAEIVQVEVMEEKGEEIQALIQQKFTFDQEGIPDQQINRTFAFSYDGGNNWIFAGVENKSYAEMKQTIPELFDELRY